MRIGTFLIRSGVLLIIIGLTAIGVFYASIYTDARDAFLTIKGIVLVLSILSILFDELFSGLIGGKLKPEVLRGIGFIVPIILISVSYLISSAIRWEFMIKLIQFSLLGLFGLAVLIFIIIALIKSRGGQQNGQSRLFTR